MRGTGNRRENKRVESHSNCQLTVTDKIYVLIRRKISIKKMTLSRCAILNTFSLASRIMMSFHRDKNRSDPVFSIKSIENLRHCSNCFSLKPWTNGNGKKTVCFFQGGRLSIQAESFSRLKSEDNVRSHDIVSGFSLRFF